MCGIAGYLNRGRSDGAKVIAEMNHAILHRGPDGEGRLVDDSVALGMRRLAIIDLATGDQPIYSEDGSVAIFFNGEIYNYRELRKGLVERGAHFTTNSDTEVILKLYEGVRGQLGKNDGEHVKNEFLLKLRGMFVFCIYDTRHQSLFIARDYFGIKPLYYALGEGIGERILGFASEIKALLKIGQYKKQVNTSVIYDYLRYQFNPDTETFFKGIFKLRPGHYMQVDLSRDNYGVCAIQKYWQFSFDQDSRLGLEKTRKQIYETISDSIKHHMIADVPVSSFLSGGIDSSIIATISSQEFKRQNPTGKFRTFTVSFDTLSEGPEAKQTASTIETLHTERIVTKDEYIHSLRKVAFHFDEPVADPSAVGLYFLAQEAGKHGKVVLSGEGADELFGGYNIYLAPFASMKVAWIPKLILRFAKKILQALEINYGVAYLERASSKLQDWYIGNANIWKPSEIKDLLKDKDEHKSIAYFDHMRTLSLSDSTAMQLIDIETWLVGDILTKADKMTMAHSLELRVPFLDIAVANLARTLKDTFKWRAGKTKFIFREAFKNAIPESTRRRKKLGFPVPISKWLREEDKFLRKTILHNKLIRDMFELTPMEKLIDDHTAGRSDNARKIYTLLLLALWHESFFG